jgi:uncharacterized membrane protein
MSKKTKKNTHMNPNEEKRAAKKAAVLGSKKKGPSAFIFIGAFAVVLMAGGIFFATQKGKKTQPATGHSAATASATQVAFPVNDFADGNAKHFRHRFDDGITVKYFILKSSDGVIRAAFDACDVCWPAGKGYYQENDVMVCRNCGRKFASVLVNEVKGGCNPAPLNRKVEGDEVVIQVADIAAGKQYFDFSKRS